MTPCSMRLMAGTLSWIAWVALAAASNAGSPCRTPQGEERAAILDTLSSPVSAELKQPIEFAPTHMRVCRNGSSEWAFVNSKLHSPGGGAVDWEAALFIDCSRTVQGLLNRKSAGAWTVVEIDVCPTDVPWAAWADQHGAPAELFD